MQNKAIEPFTIEGKKYTIEIRTRSLTGNDDLFINENAIPFLRKVSNDPLNALESSVKKARSLATVQLVVISGLGEGDPTSAIGNLPLTVINKILDEYYGQFDEVDPKN